MADKKLKIMSLSVEPETHKLLKTTAKKGGYASVSAMVRDLVHKHLDLLVNDGNEIPVILRIPSDLKGNREELQDWIDKRVHGIVGCLSKE